MRIPSTFGQYVPVDSPVHALDARTKMGVIAAFTLGLFLADGFFGLAAFAVAVAAVVRVSRVPGRIAFRGVRALGLILIFTLLAHSLRWEPATVMLVRFGPLGIDAEGLRTGVFFAARIVLLMVGTSLLTLTTTPVQLTDGLESVMRPGAALGLPTGEIAMMLTIALRFIPTTAQEAERVIIAQSARGARFDEGSLLARVRAYVPVLVPLFVNLFRRAEDLATAMDARCYRGGEGRTRLHAAVMTPGDWLVLLVCGTGLVMTGIWL
ncbi:MAG: energy-coupling factor transporter transmembrane component T [Coriobacteriia bacterium]|nr:energy-coupling factor transporter transmembrane component T [Coriobacteriia bacterium]